MSVRLDLKIDGLVKDFDQLQIRVQEAMIQELRVTGLMIESAYKIGVPVQTGRLRSSIHTEHSDQKGFSYSDNTGQTFAGGLGFNLKDTQVIVGTNVEYADKIEYFGGRTKGKAALLEAFEKETQGLPERLAKLVK